MVRWRGGGGVTYGTVAHNEGLDWGASLFPDKSVARGRDRGWGKREKGRWYHSQSEFKLGCTRACNGFSRFLVGWVFLDSAVQRAVLVLVQYGYCREVMGWEELVGG